MHLAVGTGTLSPYRCWRVSVFIRLVFVIVAFIVTYVSSQPDSLSADDRISVHLSARVPPTCNLVVKQHLSDFSAHLAAGHVAAATVAETCNSSSGYSVMITSRGGGFLRNGGTALSYSALYDDVPLELVRPHHLERDGPSFGTAHTLSINVADSAGLPSGTYEDTIVLTVSGR